MFQNMQVTTQPVFYLFLAVSLLLSLGYVWGKRKNTKIHLSAFNAVVGFLRPKDQTFTNIGGLTGYHANIVPHKNKIIRRVDLTLTLLPRQSWLYLPFSLMIKHTDRLYTTLLFGKKVKPSFGEGHLIEEKFGKTGQGAITDKDRFNSEAVLWGDKTFILYTEDEELNMAFKDLLERVKDPLTIKHIAINPGEGKAYFFMVPLYGIVSRVFGDIYNWIVKTVEPSTATSGGL